MESAFSSVTSMVYGLMGVALASFFIGYVVLGTLLKRKGYQTTNVEIICSAVTVVCLVAGFSLYRNFI